MKFLIAILFLISSLASNGQKKIIGKVTDAKTTAVIPFSTIKYNNTFITADDNGIFILSSKYTIDQADSLSASCIGYATKNIGVAKNIINDTVNVRLSDATNVLNEVTIIGSRKLETNAELIFKKFANNFLNSINDKPYDCKLFYRELSQQNNIYVDFVEAVGIKHFEGNYKTKYSGAATFTALHKFNDLRGVNARTISSASTGYHPLTWQIAADYVELEIFKYLLLNFVADIKLNINEVLSSSEKQTYVISFSPKKSSWGMPNNIYDFIKGSEGLIYLDAHNYSVEKVVFSNLNLDKRIKLKNSRYKNRLTGLKGSVNYVKINGRSTPSYIEFTYLFKDSKSSSLIAKKMQFYFSDFVFDNQTTNELAARYGTKITREYPFRGMSYPEEKKFFDNPVYRQSFWKNGLDYPEFWEMDKVRSDFKTENLILENEFKNFNNNLSK